MQASPTKYKRSKERISGADDTTGKTGNIDKTVKENAKCKKVLTQSIQEIQDPMKRKPKDNRYGKE